MPPPQPITVPLDNKIKPDRCVLTDQSKELFRLVLSSFLFSKAVINRAPKGKCLLLLEFFFFPKKNCLANEKKCRKTTVLSSPRMYEKKVTIKQLSEVSDLDYLLNLCHTCKCRPN